MAIGSGGGFKGLPESLPKNKRIGLSTANLRRVVDITYRVNRLNISGGGTLKPFFEKAPYISLEWLEPASPVVDLNEGSTFADCPLCRAVEPPRAGYFSSEASLVPNQECPVCFEERVSCVRLRCDHLVCKACWVNWCRTKSGEELEADLSPTQLAEQRDAELTEFRARKTEKNWLNKEFKKLIRDGRGDNGAQGLKYFRHALQVKPLQLWNSKKARAVSLAKLSLTGLEIFAEILEQRGSEKDGEGGEAATPNQVAEQLLEVSTSIGDKFEVCACGPDAW